MQPCHESIDIRARIIKSERRSCCGWHVKAIHDWLAAMVTGADGDSFLVQDLANVVRVNVLQDE